MTIPGILLPSKKQGDRLPRTITIILRRLSLLIPFHDDHPPFKLSNNNNTETIHLNRNVCQVRQTCRERMPQRKLPGISAAENSCSFLNLVRIRKTVDICLHERPVRKIALVRVFAVWIDDYNGTLVKTKIR